MLILIGPGTGFAPLRGFLQERAAQKAAGEAVAPSLLFFGCRHPDHDWFCRQTIERWQARGRRRSPPRLLRGGEPSVALRAGRALGGAGAGLSRDPGRRRDLPVRRRQIYGPRRPRHADPHPHAAGGRRACAGLGLAGGTDRDRPLPPGRLRFWQVSRS
ncbi:hypothetical protein AB5I41_31885 [Sphingomonas sp. MMS24-JH45]